MYVLEEWKIRHTITRTLMICVSKQTNRKLFCISFLSAFPFSFVLQVVKLSLRCDLEVLISMQNQVVVFVWVGDTRCLAYVVALNLMS